MSPTSLVSRIDLDLLYPPFRDTWLEVIGRCKDRGKHYYASLGYRTFPEQAKLYFQGRTTPGAIVTNAGPGLSLHNYGCATDNIRDGDLVKVGLQPAWDSAGYDTLREVGESLGLQVGILKRDGGRWDEGHCQLNFAALGLKEYDVLLLLKKAAENALKGEELKASWTVLDNLGFPAYMAAFRA